MEMEITGQVVRKLNFGRYLVSTKTGVIVLDSREPLEYKAYVFKVTPQGAQGQARGQGQDYTLISKRETDAKVEPEIKLAENSLIIEDEVMGRLKPMIRDCAERIARAEKSGRSIMIRYHNDADGISGGLAIYLALKKGKSRPLHRQCPSVVYTPSDALIDINLMTDSYKPLMIITDLGSGEESRDGIKLLKGAGFEVIMIDHHPYDNKPEVDCYLSGWTQKPETKLEARATEIKEIETKKKDFSKYTAGYLTAEVARALGLEDETANKLASISFSGDKSTLDYPKDDKSSLVFDYVGRYTFFPNTLDFYSSVLNNAGLYDSIYTQASEKLDNIRREGVNYLKIKEFDKQVRAEDGAMTGENFKLIVGLINADKIIKKFEFPSKAKTTSIMFETLAEKYPGLPVIMMGHGKKMITFRVNDRAAELGYSGRGLIKEVMAEFPDMIISGGGHAKAASIRTSSSDYTKIIMDWFLERIKSK